MAPGSVMGGAGALIAGRAAGMIGGFLLLMVLSRRSTAMVGEFRVALTFFGIMEFLPLLGMHRWLSVEIARRASERYAVFLMACGFALAVASLGCVVYLAIAASGLYGPSLSRALEVVALTTIASALNLCAISALIGLGCTRDAGLLGLAETAARSTLAIALVVAGSDVFAIVLVFMGTRCLVAAAGCALVHARVRAASRRIGRPLVAEFLSQAPNLGLSMVGFLAMRSAATLLLPLMRGESEAGLYSMAFQLFDMAMLAPTVLAISANAVFVESAARSPSALRGAVGQLVAITALVLFPAAALGAALAPSVIEIPFGTAYGATVLSLRVLLAAAVVLSLDQILSLAMAASGGYGADRRCMLLGASVAVVMTGLFGGRWGAPGAAAAFLLGAASTLALRIRLMREAARLPLLAEAASRPAIAALVAGAVAWTASRLLDTGPRPSIGPTLASLALGAAVYGLTLFWRGGLERERLKEVRAFMTRRG